MHARDSTPNSPDDDDKAKKNNDAEVRYQEVKSEILNSSFQGDKVLFAAHVGSLAQCADDDTIS